MELFTAFLSSWQHCVLLLLLLLAVCGKRNEGHDPRRKSRRKTRARVRGSSARAARQHTEQCHMRLAARSNITELMTENNRDKPTAGFNSHTDCFMTNTGDIKRSASRSTKRMHTTPDVSKMNWFHGTAKHKKNLVLLGSEQTARNSMMADDKQSTMTNGRVHETTQEAEHVEKWLQDGPEKE